MRVWGGLAALCGGIAVGMLQGARVTRYEIVEESMVPTLHPGDYVIAVRAGPTVRPGDIVICSSPENPGIDIVKRVAAAPGDQVELPSGSARMGPTELFVVGDNHLVARDSRAFGPVALDSVRWRVAWRYWPPGRVGRVR